MIFVLAMAFAASTALPGGSLAFDCEMSRPAGTRFNLHGTFDGKALKTNIADWPGLSTPIPLEGGLVLSVENLVHHYEWKGPGGRSRMNLKMVEYSREHAAVLTILEHYSDGRHSLDKLIGTGMCKTRRISASGNAQ